MSFRAGDGAGGCGVTETGQAAPTTEGGWGTTTETAGATGPLLRLPKLHLLLRVAEVLVVGDAESVKSMAIDGSRS
jgi:hypothetical protein